RRIGLDFEFQLPGGELAQSRIEFNVCLVSPPKNPLVLDGESPCSQQCRQKLHFAKHDFLPRSQVYVLRNVENRRIKHSVSKVDELAPAIRHGRRFLRQEQGEVLELDRILADVANPNYELGRLAGVVSPTLTGRIAQARLQATDLLAPGGEGF